MPARHLIFGILTVFGTLSLLTVLAHAQQDFPAYPERHYPAHAQDRCGEADQSEVYWAFQQAYAHVVERRLNVRSFMAHITGCSRRDLLYFRRIARL